MQVTYIIVTHLLNAKDMSGILPKFLLLSDVTSLAKPLMFIKFTSKTYQVLLLTPVSDILSKLVEK